MSHGGEETRHDMLVLALYMLSNWPRDFGQNAKHVKMYPNEIEQLPLQYDENSPTIKSMDIRFLS
jgi:hypothetical protein